LNTLSIPLFSLGMPRAYLSEAFVRNPLAYLLAEPRQWLGSRRRLCHCKLAGVIGHLLHGLITAPAKLT
jgi:hypothetical protein